MRIDRGAIHGATLLLCVVWYSSAGADTLGATLGQPLVERSHEVDITIEGGVARYRVQREFENPGAVADEASLDIDLPFGGAVTGLRIRARDQWYDGDLMEAEAAGRLYQELTGYGPFPAKDPALLQWVWADKVHLQIFPVLPGRRSAVEYTITVPTQYRNGNYLISYPRDAGPGLATPAFTIHAGYGNASTRVRIDGKPSRLGDRTPMPAPEPAAGWEQQVVREAGASYVTSVLEVPDVERARHAIRSAQLTLAISHTYRGDLHVQLISPSGEVVTAEDNTQAGTKNGIHGRFPLALQATPRAAGAWRLVVSDHAARDVGTIDSWSLTLDTGDKEPIVVRSTEVVFIPDAPEHDGDTGLLSIEVAAPPIDTVDARFGRVVASPEHGFARLEIDVADPLVPLPRRASMVFAIDASYSEGEEGIDDQIAIARACLHHVPDATVEVVLYRRFATRLFGAFVPADQFVARVEAARRAGHLSPGNGSALDAGLERATQLLRDRSGPRRIIVTSDDRLRSSFRPGASERALARAESTIVHLVLAQSGHGDELIERRDDDHELAPIARSGHGILLHIEGVNGASYAKLEPVVLGLIRPIRIDNFRVSGIDRRRAKPEDSDGWEELGDKRALGEGEGIRLFHGEPAPPERIVLEGNIWAEPLHRELVADPAFARTTAAFVFSHDEHTNLSNDEMMTLAMLGRVVSPVTSYIAVEPGVRPSVIGLRREGRGSGSGFGRGAGGLGGRRGVAQARPELRGAVNEMAAACAAQLGVASPWSLRIDVETTSDEIVDVILHRAATTALGRCVTERIWRHRLSEAFASWSREQYSMAID